MSDHYYTDREYGQVARTSEAIDERLWRGLYSLIETRLDDGSFGYHYPLACPDSSANAYGTDRFAFGHMLEAEVPWISWPLRADQVPDPPMALDLLEFCADAVGEPEAGSFHSYFQHHHLSWDREAGLARFVGDVNRLFARNGVAFDLTAAGKASHPPQKRTSPTAAMGQVEAQSPSPAIASR